MLARPSGRGWREVLTAFRLYKTARKTAASRLRLDRRPVIPDGALRQRARCMALECPRGWRNGYKPFRRFASAGRREWTGVDARICRFDPKWERRAHLRPDCIWRCIQIL